MIPSLIKFKGGGVLQPEWIANDPVMLLADCSDRQAG